jgi:transcriptional regulator with XRE-family HTH domain
MSQPRKPRKVDDPELHAVIRELLTAGTFSREAVAAQFGYSAGTVQTARGLVEAGLTRSAGQPDNGRLVRVVRNFNGRKLYHIRFFERYLMQGQLGEMAGKSRGEIGHLERLERRPTLRTLLALTSALELYHTDRKGRLIPGEDGNPVLDPSRLLGKYTRQPAELIAEGETVIYDPLRPVPLAELIQGEAHHERKQTA